VPNSQSHLFSLAQLLESAEQRQSSMPPPPVQPSSAEDDSGLIDILAMQARAREAAARPSSRTPLPVVASMRSAERDARRAHTDPDVAAALAANVKRKQRQAMLGGVAAGVGLIAFAIALLIAFAIAFASSVQAPGVHHAAAAQVAAPVAPVVAPPPPAVAPPPVEVAPPPAAPDTVAVAARADPPKPKTKSKKKSSHVSHPSHAGPSLMKVISGGTAP
jgi:hypothetical protein